jgi:hypothetical protein
MTVLTADLNPTNLKVSRTHTFISHFSEVSIYNFVYAVSLVTDAPFIDTVLLGSDVPIRVFLCCEIYVLHSPPDCRFMVIAINATVWGHAFQEVPENSGFISEFTSSIFLRKFCRGPGSVPCGIFGGKKGIDTDFCPSTRLYPVIMIP